MTKPACSKILLAAVAVVMLVYMPKPVSAQRDGGSHRGGGSPGGSSKGSGSVHGGGGSRGGGGFRGGGDFHGGSFFGGSFRGGGHSNFSGGGHSYGGSRGGTAVWSSHLGGGLVSSGQTRGGSYSRPGGFFSRPSDNFARNSTFGSGSFGGSAVPRNSARLGAPQWAARSFRTTAEGWHSFGDSAGQSMPASARTSGNAMRGGWHSFGNLSRGGGAEMIRGYGNHVREGGQWHAFGNSRNPSFSMNTSGFSNFRASRAMESNARAPRLGFNSNRFSTNVAGSSRFPSFSSGRSMSNFRSSRFGNTGFGGFDFGNSGFGHSGFSSSFIGSDISLIPNLLFGGLFRVGTAVFGGPGLLGANVLALAASSIVSGIVSNGFGGGDAGFAPSGFGPGLGFDVVPVEAPCGAGVSFGRPGWQ
jgi:hypothetical protein